MLGAQQEPATPRDPRWKQQIIKFAGTLLYLRVDTGPDHESALLCFDDDDADTFDLSRMYSLKTARILIEIMRHAGHAPSAELDT